MNQDPIASILGEAEGCCLPLDEALSLPPRSYNDAEWFDLERERLFHSGWVGVARSSELAEANQFVTTTIAGEPCVVVRGRDGALRALSNVCPHRSSTLVGAPSGSAPSLQCPYHLWTFNHDGELRAAPGMEQAADFQLNDYCLSSFAVDEWQGFVLVNVDSSAVPLGECAPQLDALFTENRIGELVSLGRLVCPSPWNWKITAENFLESYHHRGIHPETLEARFPAAQSFGVAAGDEPWSGVDHVSVVDGEIPFIALSVYPSLLIAITRQFGMLWFRTNPVAPDHTELIIEGFALPEFAEEPGVAEAVLSAVERINDEDVSINERTAEGLRSKFARPGRVSHLELSPWHFRRWIVERMSN